MHIINHLQIILLYKFMSTINDDDELEQKLYHDYILAKHKYFMHIQPKYQKKYEEYIIKSEKIYVDDFENIVGDEIKINRLLKTKELKKVYRKLSLIYHPDKSTNSDSLNDMQLLNQLYEKNDIDTLLYIENISNGKRINLERIIEYKKYKDDIIYMESTFYYLWNISGCDFSKRMTKNEYIEKLNKRKCEYEIEINHNKKMIDIMTSSNKQYEEIIIDHEQSNSELKELIQKNIEIIECYNKIIINNTKLVEIINKQLESIC
jgi:hypothetical protein